jgi:hypothetical protein
MNTGGWTALAALEALEIVTMWLMLWSMSRAESQAGARPNRWYGIRSRATMASDQAWIAAHRASLPVMKTIGHVVLPLTGIVLAIAVADARAAFWGESVLAVGAAIWMGVGSMRAASRAARALAAPDLT